MEIYLDNSATTRCFPEVVDLMTKVYLEDYGNPSSMHMKGVDSENYTYTSNQLLYVMEPDKESVLEAKNLISIILTN